jgi:hypothetical protein
LLAFPHYLTADHQFLHYLPGTCPWLADQCIRLHRNQLLGELDEARAALDASQGQVKQLEAEVAELRGLADMLRLTGALK